jgi:hypothetical protein
MVSDNLFPDNINLSNSIFSDNIFSDNMISYSMILSYNIRSNVIIFINNMMLSDNIM